MEQNKWNLYVSPQTMIVFTVMVLIIPLDWLLALTVAATVHELFHCMAVYICGKKIYSVCIHMYGATIQTQTLTYLQTAFCALAGPVGGLLLTFVRRFPLVALCAWLQSLYNLLPVYPLDGGKVLRSVTNIFLGEDLAAFICEFLAAIVIGTLLIFCMAIAVALNTVLPMLIPLSLLIQSRSK